ncbi:unnamed protein product [Adineta ricciae]|uniref:Ubiquitin thioesterase OTU n=1 Tax=Adineta ricciae TaxID=249248 RepID=A0A816AC45_ADIRI|nr:unnamed protein product [Adineta ricciae]
MRDAFTDETTLPLRAKEFENSSCPSPSTIGSDEDILGFELDEQTFLNKEDWKNFNRCLALLDEEKNEPSKYAKIFSMGDKKYEFRLGEVHNDDLSLFSSVLCGADRVDFISPAHLHEIVCSWLNELHETNQECTNKENLKGFDERRFRVLARLYPKCLFCVICPISINQQITSIIIYKYVNDIMSYNRCVFILCNISTGQCQPLYLYNNQNGEEEKSKFRYDDSVMRDLLREFVSKQWNYTDELKYEHTELDEVGISDQNQTDTSDICRLLGTNFTPEIENISGMKTFMFAIHIRLFHHKVETNSQVSNDGYSEQIQSNVNQADINFLPENPLLKYKESHQFVQEKVPGDGHCLFYSLCLVLPNLTKSDYKQLRRMVANYIRQSEIIDNETWSSYTHLTREKYCYEIEHTNKFGDEMEVRACSWIYKIVIRVVTVVRSDYKVTSVHITEFPDDDELSFDKCVYIILDGEHYEPLYVTSIDRQDEAVRTFEYHDRSAFDLLKNFIQQKFHYFGKVEVHNRLKQLLDPERHSESVNDHFDVSKLAKIDGAGIASNKRKLLDEQGTPMISTKKTSSIPTACQGKDVYSRVYLHPTPASDQNLSSDIINDQSNIIKNLLQASASPILHSPKNKAQREKLSGTVSRYNNSDPLDCGETQPCLTLEIQPMPEFRARLESDYISKSATKRNGTPSEPRLPVYFSDKNHNHWLNLLISNSLLFNNDPSSLWIEICIVTQTINKCIFVNPLFEFYCHNIDSTLRTLNPIMIKLESMPEYKIEEYSKNWKCIKLYLAVIRVTNADLVRKQPIIRFDPPSSKVSSNVVVTFGKADEFKRHYTLHKLRFAFTPWLRKGSESEHHRRADLRYISEVSTANKDFKISNANKINISSNTGAPFQLELK